MTDPDPGIHDEISRLVSAEKDLRSRMADGGATDADRAELRRIEAALDQCWDLLRQRDARREFGQDAGTAQSRDIGTVEGYLQ